MPPTVSDGISISASADRHAAETKSSLLLTKYSIEEPGFDVVTLASAMGIVVREGGLENADAWLFRRQDGKGVLRISDSVGSRARRRFSIAHELGHWEMHPDLKQGRYCTESDLIDYVRSREEVEANCFAASLLMPRFLFRERIDALDPSFELIDAITSEFETSRIATARRFIELTKYRVILVCTIGEEVSWRVKSDSAKYFALGDSKLPVASLSARARKSNQAKGTLTAISPQIWLKENPVMTPQELFEDVRYSPRLDMALTLLWFI